MDRLTRKLDNGRYAQNYTTGDGFFVGMTEMMQKLGELEDLEESGRLIVLPEGFDMEGFCNQISGSACPHHYLLHDSEDCTYDITCEKCWEAALKGASHED